MTFSRNQEYQASDVRGHWLECDHKTHVPHVANYIWRRKRNNSSADDRYQISWVLDLLARVLPCRNRSIVETYNAIEQQQNGQELGAIFFQWQKNLYIPPAREKQMLRIIRDGGQHSR